MKQKVFIVLLALGATSALKIETSRDHTNELAEVKGPKIFVPRKNHHIASKDVDTEFAKFRTQFNKKYDTTNTFSERRNVFAKNLEAI